MSEGEREGECEGEGGREGVRERDREGERRERSERRGRGCARAWCAIASWRAKAPAPCGCVRT